MNAITLKWEGIDLHASRDAWFNATEIAALFDKRPIDWLRLPETERYIAALCQREAEKEAVSNVGKSHICAVRKTRFIKTRRGNNGGTWLHPKLAIRFAQWLDVNFAIWCDEQIEALLTERPAWQAARAESKIGAQVMAEILQTTRAAAGKETKAYHYSNEALLCNEALTGRREALPRDNLPAPVLRMLIRLEAANAALMAHGKPYHERKARLQDMAASIRLRHTEALQ
mgnify:CR=1 FL=1